MQTCNQKNPCQHYVPKAAKRLFIPYLRQLPAALNTRKKTKAVSNFYTLAAIFIILLFSSCQKEKLSEDAMLNSATSSAFNTATAKTSTGGAFTGIPNKKLSYGAMICPPNTSSGWLGFQQNVAVQLGVTCLRGSTMVPGNGITPALLGSGYKVLLNFNTTNDTEDDDEDDNNEGAKMGSTPVPFVKDLVQYKIDLGDIIALCLIKPVVAVIENEECNRFYYSGYAWDYIKQLNAAITVMHANGIKVANGGLTGGGLNYLVYQDFMEQGKYDSAEQFRKIAHVTPNNPTTQSRGVFVDSLLQAYYQMDVDYVNFHWKGGSPDTEALKDVINYLKKRSNKPVINNELGQFDKDPNTLLEHVQLCTDQKLPYILWYSPDENDSKRATPLQYDDATLTLTGNAYQGYLAK